jgi:pimeloyl-ACP methyl ester carboxylesterase
MLDVRIVAYSWGVGYGAMQLARLLRGEGVRVRNLVSCDGVWHSRWMPWRAVLSPLFGEPEIVVPANVQRVDCLMQKNTLPRGHVLRADVPELTVIADHGDLAGVTHTDIDNAEQFLTLALERCRG